MEPHPGKDFIRSHIAGRETHDDIEFRRELPEADANHNKHDQNPEYRHQKSIGKKLSTGSMDACMVADKAGKVSKRTIPSTRRSAVSFGIQARLDSLWRGLSLHRRGDQWTIRAWVI